MKMMGQDADGFGRPLIGRHTTTSLAFFPPCFREFLALRVKTKKNNKMGGRQKGTGKKGICRFECGCSGLQLPLLLQQQFSNLLDSQLLVFTSQRFSMFLYCTLAAVISLVGSTQGTQLPLRQQRRHDKSLFSHSNSHHSAFTPHDYLSAFTHQQFHTATPTFLLSH